MTSVVLPLIPLPKWHKRQGFKAQHRTLSNDFLRILRELQINYFLKIFLGGHFKLTTDIGKAGRRWFQQLKQKLGEEDG